MSIKDVIIGKYKSMKIIIMIVISLLLLIIMLLSCKIKVKITKYHRTHTNVDLYITEIFNFHIDLDEKVKNYIKNKNIRKFLLDIKKGLRFYFEHLLLLKQLSAQIKIQKITITSKYQAQNVVIDSYLKFTNWLIYSSINRLLENNFMSVDNTYYQVSSQNTEVQIGYVIEMTTRLYRLIKIYFKNYQQLRKEKKKNGTSN